MPKSIFEKAVKKIFGDYPDHIYDEAELGANLEKTEDIAKKMIQNKLSELRTKKDARGFCPLCHLSKHEHTCEVALLWVLGQKEESK